MSASYETETYKFPLFDPNDKPSWLNDWNQTMKALDAAIKAAANGVTPGVFQPLLKSGENIKTINGSSILGAGDLPIIPEVYYKTTPTTSSYPSSQFTTAFELTVDKPGIYLLNTNFVWNGINNLGVYMRILNNGNVTSPEVKINTSESNALTCYQHRIYNLPDEENPDGSSTAHIEVQIFPDGQDLNFDPAGNLSAMPVNLISQD